MQLDRQEGERDYEDRGKDNDMPTIPQHGPFDTRELSLHRATREHDEKRVSGVSGGPFVSGADALLLRYYQ